MEQKQMMQFHIKNHYIMQEMDLPEVENGKNPLQNLQIHMEQEKVDKT